MDTTSNMDTASNTVQAIAERKQFLSKVVAFVQELLFEKGKEVSFRQGQSHTHIVKEFRDFENFSFFGDFGQSMMGGNDVRITYRLPNTEKEEEVFHVHWMPCSFTPDDAETEVKVFAEKSTWLNKLTKVMKDKKKILARFEKEKERARKAVSAEYAQKAKDQATADEAKRLGL